MTGSYTVELHITAPDGRVYVCLQRDDSEDRVMLMVSEADARFYPVGKRYRLGLQPIRTLPE